MVRMEVISPDGHHHCVIGITRADFEGMKGQGAVRIELDDNMKLMGSIFIISGETDDSIEREINKKMMRMPEV